jgi:hypothetical protein
MNNMRKRPVCARFLLPACVALIVVSAGTARAYEPGPDAVPNGGGQASAVLTEAYATVPELDTALGAALAAGVDSAVLAELTQRAAAQALPAEDLLRAVNRVESLARQDLPVMPVLSRYLQGMAKGVPMVRIEAAVDELETRLILAASHLDRTVVPSDDVAARLSRLVAIDHGAYALGVGVDAADLDRSIAMVSHEASPMDAVQAPLLALGVLVASGVEPDKSLQVVSSAWEHGYRGDDLKRLGKALGRLGQGGEGPPEDVVDHVLALIDSNTGPERVFQGLDDLGGQEGAYPPGMGPGETPVNPRGPGQRPQEPGNPQRNDQQQNSVDSIHRG